MTFVAIMADSNMEVPLRPETNLHMQNHIYHCTKLMHAQGCRGACYEEESLEVPPSRARMSYLSRSNFTLSALLKLTSMVHMRSLMTDQLNSPPYEEFLLKSVTKVTYSSVLVLLHEVKLYT